MESLLENQALSNNSVLSVSSVAAWFGELLQSASTACAFRSSKSQNARHASCVAARTTFGACPASSASCHRGAHKHHLSPGCRPGKPNCRFGVDRSFPAAFEKARNSAVSTTQTVCDPTSSGPVLQQPSRKKPVIGNVQQVASLPPSTFFAFGSRTTPFVFAMRIIAVLVSSLFWAAEPSAGSGVWYNVRRTFRTLASGQPDRHCSDLRGQWR
jgi:hypothetical protein